MRKILIVGDFSSDTSDVNSYLEQHFHTQLCTNSGKIVKSMLKMYAPELVLMDIDGFENLQEEVFEAIKEYNPDLPVITYGREKKKQLFISYYYSGQCRHIAQPTREVLIREICKEFNMNADVIINAVVDTEKKHIIVVDDNPVLLRNMRNMLQDKYRVTLATSAAQCMKAMGQDSPDLIILDYEMPVVDGKQTLEMIRAEEDYKDVPVIFLTGIADKEHVDAVLDLKPAGYFVKPPMQTKIINAIENIFLKQGE
ncbi:response regulator [Pseudobutyrivibrio xylanivorans]|uniref:Stage 0 sporulation protein A homolog n=1 Tax=Pseudobutyrivibrio xylanivorans TaxID=185007 RepID=A0A1G5RQS3_PSEXY|nr:response regulator [Pseudobutyrivibrio xylanivorans]SCZ76432.1 Response regulator receiver domain-containing protein [Pseudobutyrivibrio xylanivorans]